MDGVEMCAGGSSKHGAHMHRPSHTAHQPHGRCVYPLPLPNPHAMPQAIARWGFERYRRRVRRVSSTLADRADSVERRCVQGVVRKKVPGADATRGTLTRVGWRRAGTANATAFSGGMLWDFAEGTIAVTPSGDSCVSQRPTPFAPLCS